MEQPSKEEFMARIDRLNEAAKPEGVPNSKEDLVVYLRSKKYDEEGQIFTMKALAYELLNSARWSSEEMEPIREYVEELIKDGVLERDSDDNTDGGFYKFVE